MSAEENRSHLVERAAERLLRSGAAPGLGGSMPPPNDEDPPRDDVPLPIADTAIHTRSDARPAVNGNGRQPLSVATLRQAGVLDGTNGQSRNSEEFRLVQAQVLRTAQPQSGEEPGFTNVMMVTSARPKEGKTFTALNLAASIARQGDRPVLLVDADAKQGSLCDALGLSDAPGLLDMVAEPQLDPAALICATDLPLLSVLPIGRARVSRPESVVSGQILRAVQSLGHRFPERLIILDVSPCLSTSDPATLSPMVGQVVFVVEAERTQREAVEASLDLIQTCPTITLLLNKVQMSTPRSFAAYSYAYSS